MTQVVTFMIRNSVGTVNFSFLDGVDDSRHENVTSPQNRTRKTRPVPKRSRLAHRPVHVPAGKSESIPEDDSNVLANSVILCGSALRDEQQAQTSRSALLLAGNVGRQNRFRTTHPLVQ